MMNKKNVVEHTTQNQDAVRFPEMTPQDKVTLKIKGKKYEGNKWLAIALKVDNMGTDLAHISKLKEAGVDCGYCYFRMFDQVYKGYVERK